MISFKIFFYNFTILILPDKFMNKSKIVRYFTIITFLIFLFDFSYSQIDTLKNNYIVYSNEFKFTDGIYLDFNQVKTNNPVLKSQIITTYNTKSFDFFDNLILEKYISIYDDLGTEQKVATDDIWGYCNNGAIYVQKNDRFNRIGVIGSISHFVSYETVYDNMYPYTYGYDSYNYPSTSTELRQYLLNFETGEIIDYTVKGVQIFLMQDTALYDEFNNLKNRQKKKLTFVYIRKYNELHPLIIPIN